MQKIFLASLIFALGACAQMQKKSEPTPETSSTTTPAEAQPAPTKAQAVLKSANGSKVKGIIHFTEEDRGMKVETIVEGLKPGPHGFHIHETGDCSKADFSSAGGHFNPEKGHHGSRDSKKRHAGDMGNLVADNKGKANVTMTVEGMTMKPGAQSIIGKAVVIHADKDDLKSQPAGNSGARIACGVIEAL